MRSGGQVLDNLWRWSDTGTIIEFRFLDDGGLLVDYDGADSSHKWNNVMWRGALADADMRVGETYFLAEFGEATATNTNVRFLDADMRIIAQEASPFERAFTVSDDAAYVEMYVSLIGKQEPQRSHRAGGGIFCADWTWIGLDRRWIGLSREPLAALGWRGAFCV